MDVNYYQEMAEKKLHCFFLYDDIFKFIFAQEDQKLATITSKGTEEEKSTEIG